MYVGDAPKPTVSVSVYCAATNVTMNQYSKKDVLQFMKLAIPWLEQQDWIVGYAWFSFAFNDPLGVPSSFL